MPRKRKFADGRATVMLKYGIDQDIQISLARQCVRVRTTKGDRAMTLAEFLREAARQFVELLRSGRFVPSAVREDELPIAEVLPFPSPPDPPIVETEEAS